ncbi:MAG: hypothetical protein EA428_09750 [Spirochaetaceae bacterium]|nr:MAG: hypothetical protein EA428_09750 [Spirochaetaceae bacterium]
MDNAAEQLVWEEPVRIHTFDVGPDNRATAPALGKYLQEAASRQAASLGFGYDNLGENDLFWVLSRLAVEVYRYPRWNEELSLYTWPAGLAPPYALRSFRLISSSGETVAEAGSAWLTIEASTRRPRRVETVIDAKQYEQAERVLADRLTRIRVPERASSAASTALLHAWEETRRVRPSDLDGQNHTNNMTYLEWILDGFDGPQPSELELKSFRMNFLKETHNGDLVELWYVPLDATETETIGMSGIALQNGGGPVVSTELTFVPRRA